MKRLIVIILLAVLATGCETPKGVKHTFVWYPPLKFENSLELIDKPEDEESKDNAESGNNN